MMKKKIISSVARTLIVTILCWDLQVTILVHCIYNVSTPLSTLSIGPGKTSTHMHDINDHQRK